MRKMIDDLYLREVSLSSSHNCNFWCNLPFYKDLVKGNKMRFETPVTFLVGENGCGKSTLLEAIAVSMGYNAEGGSKNFNFATNDTTATLHNDIRLARVGYESDGFFLRAESFYNVATNIEELNLNLSNYGGISLHDQSHGESFLALIGNRFRGRGFYVLDEPEAALSPMGQLTLLVEIDRLVKDKSQFIIGLLPGECVFPRVFHQ